MSSVPSTTEDSRSLLLEVPLCDEDEIKSLMDDAEFPSTSIRVLLVDADSESCLLLKNLMTEQFSYQVTSYEKGGDAMDFLKRSKHEIDLVIWDFDVPKINGQEALKNIDKEMDLPVVITSRDNKKERVMKTYGACDFLVKPVSKEVTSVLWRHVFNKKKSRSGISKRKSRSGLSNSVESEAEEDETDDPHLSEGSKTAEYSGEQNTCCDGQRGKFKKPRMTWTPELHDKFVVAIERTGGDVEKAFPKQILKILREMGVQGLSRNNVASHLQKYRLGANKKNKVPQDTQEGLAWHNAMPTAASKPFLNAGRNLQYSRNDQATAIQYPSSGYQTLNNNNYDNPFLMTNTLANMTYLDQIYQQPQQQQYYSSLQIPSVVTSPEPGLVENSDQLIYDRTILPSEPEFYHPSFNNYGQFHRY